MLSVQSKRHASGHEDVQSVARPVYLVRHPVHEAVLPRSMQCDERETERQARVHAVTRSVRCNRRCGVESAASMGENRRIGDRVGADRRGNRVLGGVEVGNGRTR